MNYHILIRDPALNSRQFKSLKSGTLWYVQDALVKNRNTNPKGLFSLEVGDTVYLYEKGFAVWAKSIILEKTDMHVLKNMEDIKNFILTKRQYENSAFWGETIVDKIFPKMNEGEFKAYKVFELKLKATKLDNPIFIKMNQGGYRKLTGPLIESDHTYAKLDPKIPSALRYKIFDKFKIHSENMHIIDIDHVVPKSLGGPGNIEENLIPVGGSINRTKGNNVPKALFDIAKKYQKILELKDSDFDFKNISKKDFGKNLLGGEDVKQKAKKIIAKINAQEFDQVKEIYNEIRFVYYPTSRNLY